MADAKPIIRSGGRSARVRETALAAAVDLTAAVGFDAWSMEDVAARAGVHKTTIYRRWPTKSALVVDAIRARSAQAVPVPDTGTLQADLQAFARSISRNLEGAGGVIARALVAASGTSDELQAETGEFWRERFAIASVIVTRAIERGEVAPGTDPQLVIEMLIGPLYVRHLLTGASITPAFLRRLAAQVVASVAA